MNRRRFLGTFLSAVATSAGSSSDVVEAALSTGLQASPHITANAIISDFATRLTDLGLFRATQIAASIGTGLNPVAPLRVALSHTPAGHDWLLNDLPKSLSDLRRAKPSLDQIRQVLDSLPVGNLPHSELFVRRIHDWCQMSDHQATQELNALMHDYLRRDSEIYEAYRRLSAPGVSTQEVAKPDAAQPAQSPTLSPHNRIDVGLHDAAHFGPVHSLHRLDRGW